METISTIFGSALGLLLICSISCGVLFLIGVWGNWYKTHLRATFIDKAKRKQPTRTG